MRVMQVMAGGEYGGAEAFFVRLVLALHRAGLEQRAVIRAHPGRADKLREGGMAPIELRFGGGADLATRWHLRSAIRTFRPDIVMSWMNRATHFCPRGRFVHVGRLGGYYDLKYYRRCDHLVGNTEDIVGYLMNAGWPEEKAHYLPNFVEGEPVAPASRAELYTPQGGPLVLALGRLHENKAFDTLIRALPHAPDAYLWIAGEGEQRVALEELAMRLAVKPRVRFLGWRDDVPSLLRAADMLVCSSRHEPLGNVVLEAWAQACPVIATDAAGPAALIDHMDNGILVPVDDYQTLGQAMNYLIEENDLRARIARRGYDTYQQRFTESIVVRQYQDFFEKVVG